MKLLIDVDEGGIVDFPAPMDELVQLDFADNAAGVGIRGWSVKGEDGTRFQVRFGMSDWAAMQLLGLLQQYASLQGYEPVQDEGPEPEGWQRVGTKN